MGRGLMIALALSLGANVFLGGFVAGRLLNRPPPIMPPPPSAAGLALPGELFGRHADLSPETRKIIRGAYASRREAFRESRADAKRLRNAFSRALAADPWDRADAEAALAEWRAFESMRRTETAMLMIDIFEKLPADERAAVTARARERHGAQRRDHRWQDRGDE